MGLLNKVNIRERNRQKKQLQEEVKRQRVLAHEIHEVLSQSNLTVREAQVALQVVSSQIENSFHAKRLEETIDSLEINIPDKDKNKQKVYADLIEVIQSDFIQVGSDLVKGFINAVDGEIALENTKRSYTELPLELLE